jgi:hypothetical protein
VRAALSYETTSQNVVLRWPSAQEAEETPRCPVRVGRLPARLHAAAGDGIGGDGISGIGRGIERILSAGEETGTYFRP